MKTPSPLRQQYNRIKSKYPGAILLFRVGDFYESFGDDAVKVSEICALILTHKNEHDGNRLALAGFQAKMLDTYLPKLVRAGNRVAICDLLSS